MFAVNQFPALKVVAQQIVAGDIKFGGDVRLGGSGANGLCARAIAQHHAERAKQNGFTSAGFARDGCEATGKIDVQFAHQSEIPDGEM